MTTLYTADQLAKKLVPNGSEWTLDHVAGALGELTIWCLEYGHWPKQDCADVVREIREMNMSYESRDAIVAQLATVSFECEWTLPKFETAAAGFRML